MSTFGIMDFPSRLVLADVPDVRPRILQCMVFCKDDKTTIIAHLHGVWFKENSKGDDPRRITQSRVVAAHLAMLARRHNTKRIVFGGDLNLDIGTEAIAILERGFDGMPLRNLIREYGIKSTRTPRYRKFGQEGESRYADYVFVSPEVEVLEFSVDTTELASDHAPLRIVFR
jgi:endonuclease/exonuclease/phosphatase family metal-dependent hydrolase